MMVPNRSKAFSTYRNVSDLLILIKVEFLETKCHNNNIIKVIHLNLNPALLTPKCKETPINNLMFKIATH